jgi:uncharacterized membrane protein (DUF4010 family)
MISLMEPTDITLTTIFADLGLALGLGLLVGLQRERADAAMAGIRTFPVVTILGTLSAYLARDFGPWLVAVALLAVGALAILGSLEEHRQRPQDPGLTTELSLLLMFAVGAYLVVGETTVAIVVGGGLAVLLQLKAPMHALVDRIGDEDFKAITQFILISLVILPVLPDRTYGPFDVLNPRQVWLMVVLIVGIGLGGYIAYKIFGQRAGSVLAGVLGGVISSTATTLSYSRSSQEESGKKGSSETAVGLAALVITIASTVAFCRVLVEIAVVAPGSLASLAPPLLAMLAVMTSISFAAWYFGRNTSGEMPEQGNPSQLRSALIFGGLYAVILLAVAAAREYFGESGLYVVAVLSGLTDVDAITLSTAQMISSGKLAVAIGWRVILLAAMANLGFKLGLVAALGSRPLLRRVATLWSGAGVAGALILWLWP